MILTVIISFLVQPAHALRYGESDRVSNNVIDGTTWEGTAQFAQDQARLAQERRERAEKGREKAESLQGCAQTTCQKESFDAQVDYQVHEILADKLQKSGEAAVDRFMSIGAGAANTGGISAGAGTAGAD